MWRSTVGALGGVAVMSVLWVGPAGAAPDALTINTTCGTTPVAHLSLHAFSAKANVVVDKRFCKKFARVVGASRAKSKVTARTTVTKVGWRCAPLTIGATQVVWKCGKTAKHVDMTGYFALPRRW